MFAGFGSIVVDVTVALAVNTESGAADGAIVAVARIDVVPTGSELKTVKQVIVPEFPMGGAEHIRPPPFRL